jgi:hypothetical protein
MSQSHKLNNSGKYGKSKTNNKSSDTGQKIYESSSSLFYQEQ